jgi:Fe-S cluster assembly protein SufD
LQARRRAAAARLAETPLPGPDEEVWRYSRVAELEPDRFSPPAGPAPTVVPDGARRALEAAGPRAGAAVVVDGTVVHLELDPALVRAGVEFGRLAELDGGEEALGAVATTPVDVFALMNDARCAEPVLLRVPPALVVERPVVVVDWITAEGIAVFPRLVVQAGEGSEVQVVEWQGDDDVYAFAAPVVELDVGPAARVGHLHVQRRGSRCWQIGSQVSRVAGDGTLVAAQAGLGGDYARSRTDCRLEGRGATGNLLAVYFGEGDQTLDFRTFQDHLAPDTTSNLLFKGAVGGRSRSVYTGLIHVGKQARGTDAFQTNRNIKLSDEAWAESVPNLEIENNDVRCSHASTVGPVDGDQRFYLESRGVPPAVAERLIVRGFFDEVLAQLPVPAVAPVLAAEIDARLERRASGWEER